MRKSLAAALSAVVVPAALLTAAGTAQAAPEPVAPAATAPAKATPGAVAAAGKKLAAAGDVTIQNRYNNRCLQAKGDAPGFDVRLMDCDANDPRQQWDIAWVYTQAGGYYELRSAPSGLCLDADWASIGGNGTRMQVWTCQGTDQTNQHWRMRPVTNLPNTFEVTVETNNRCLDGDLNSIGWNGGRVLLWNCLGPAQVNQQWRIV
ncbi:RICIN domain-containing protein [Streptomyces yaizuensis]|uniref:RICIN domain-containing protein n=1 Tax=Streptomyces yaizuensis TaxID=2989713 RepID=A0ABQ5PAK6_9ACTN|nr:RICIN domain-containing protein [Streptomyces sp. YSPA8]GLF99530.1 RICIN domain-containing protein [Streptomyces sp. YSPA8]